jgi:hypothetical protein
VDSVLREKHGKKCFCSPHIHPLFLWRGTESAPEMEWSPPRAQKARLVDEASPRIDQNGS